jgi:ABC-2 type transport system permease protein
MKMNRFVHVRSVIRHEFELMFADRRIIASVALLLLVTSIGILSGLTHLRHRLSTIEALQANERNRHESIRLDLSAPMNDSTRKWASSFDSRSPAVVGGQRGSSFAILPPTPLTVLAIGQSDLQPTSFRISTDSFRKILDEDEIANPGHLLSGRIDLGFAMIVLYPLVILAISYDMLSSEKEAGTLVLLMSQPIRLSDVIFGKVIARFLAISAGTFMIAIAVLAFGVEDARDASTLIRWALWVAFLILYGAIWFGISVAANLRGSSSASNALILSASWLMLVLILPTMINLVTTSAYPIPSRIALVQATRQAAIDVSEEGSRTLAEYFEDHPELSEKGEGNVDEFQVRSLATRHAIETKVQPLNDRFDSSLKRRQNLIRKAQYLSPALLAQDAIESIAGTDHVRYSEFLRQAERFHRQWQDFFVPRIARKQLLKSDDLDDLPEFRFQERTTPESLIRLSGPAAGLIIQLAFVLSIVSRSIRRFRVVA